MKITVKNLLICEDILNLPSKKISGKVENMSIFSMNFSI